MGPSVVLARRERPPPYHDVMSIFELVCEIEPATRPDLMRVRHQIGVLSTIASGFLIPDNHIGRATVSRRVKSTAGLSQS